MSGGTARPLRVAMIGHGFMGAAHSQGWSTAPRVFDLPAAVEMSVVVGRNADAVADAAAKWGWAESATDWRQVIARDDIDVVDIVTPGDSHAEIAIAALDAGKHVLVEKPLANSVAEAEAMTDAATSSTADNHRLRYHGSCTATAMPSAVRRTSFSEKSLSLIHI